MSIRKRLFAVSCLGLALAQGGLGALLPASSAQASPVEAPGLDDVQIGERGDRTRIALICEDACSLAKRSDSEFLLRGANADLMLELGEHSRNVAGLTAISAGGGSLVKVSLAREIDYADAKTCVVSGRQAACIDLFFKPAGGDKVAAKPAAAATRASSTPRRSDAAQTPHESAAAVAPRPALRAEPQTGAATQDQPARRIAEANAPVLREPPGTDVTTRASSALTALVAPTPGLRDGGPARLFRFAAQASPERLAPPQGVTLAKLQPAGEPFRPANAFGGAVRLKPASATGSAFSVDQQILTILGKDLTPAYCARARTILNSDPWALNAMGDIGLCALVEGKAEEAEAILSRLLEYTPDHYEAHVGRALVAAQAGERSIARRYFQDALNALPPIEESDRIVAAMDAL